MNKAEFKNLLGQLGFVILMSLTFFILFFEHKGDVHVMAVLLLLWSGFLLLRALWLGDVLRFTSLVIRKKQRENLPVSLLRAMNEKKMSKQLKNGMRPFNILNTALFVLIFGYIVWIAINTLNPIIDRQYLELMREIHLYFSLYNLEPKDMMNINFVLSKIPLVLISVFCFFLSQSYSNNRSEYKVVIKITAALFVFYIMSMIWNFQIIPIDMGSYKIILHGYGYGHTEILQRVGLIPDQEFSSMQLRLLSQGLPAALFLYGIGMLIGLSFILSLVRLHHQQSLYAGLGLVVLTMMLTVDNFIAYDSNLSAFWFTSWSLLACLLVFARKRGQRIYRMHMGV